MLWSSGISAMGIEAPALCEHGPEDVDSSSGEGDERLMMALSVASFAFIEGAADRIAEAEGGLVEDPLERVVGMGRPLQALGLARLPQDWSDACRGRQGAGASEAADLADLGQELGSENDPHAGQAADEGPVRVVGKQGLESLVELGNAAFGLQGFRGHVADQLGGGDLGRQGDLGMTGGLQCRPGQALGPGLAEAGADELSGQPARCQTAQLAGGDEAGQ